MAPRVEQIRAQDSALPVEDDGFVVVRSEAIKPTTLFTDLYNYSVSLLSSIFKAGKGYKLTPQQLYLAERVTIIEDAPEAEEQPGEPPRRASVADEPVIPVNHEAVLQFRNKWLQARLQPRDTSHVPPAPPLPNFRYDYETNIKLKVRRPEDGLATVRVEIINPLENKTEPSKSRGKEKARSKTPPPHEHLEDSDDAIDTPPIAHDTIKDSSPVSEAGPATQAPTTFLGQIIEVLSHKLESKLSILEFTSLILEKFIPSNELILSLSHNEHNNIVEFEITLKDNYKGFVSSKPDVPKGVDWVILYPSIKMKLQIYIYQDELIIFFNSDYPFSVSMLQNIPIWGPTYLPKITCNSARITDTHAYVKIIGGKELKNSFTSFQNNYDQVRWKKA